MDDIASVPEHLAEGATSALYADIRQTLRVPVINLVWRHLATLDGALARVWNCVKPLYLDGRLEDDAAALRAPPGLPVLVPWDRPTLRAAGLDEPALASVRTIFSNYHATNPLNLLALLAVLARIEGTALPRRSAPWVAQASAAPPIGTLPALLDPATLPPPVRRAAMRLNDLGLPPGERALVAGVPRHLAHWPDFLALCGDALAPVAGEIGSSIEFVHADGWMRARRLAADLPLLNESEWSDAVADALRHFTSVELIANYIPKVSALMAALPD